MQLSTLQDVYRHPGPYVTVHMDVSRNSEDALTQIETRWNNSRQTLEAEGVDASLIDRIGELVLEPTDVPGEVRRTIVAAGEEILLDDILAGHSPWPESVSCGELPDVSGYLQQVDGQMPFLLVVADRTGADLDFYRALVRADSMHTEVEGETLHIHKFHGGGWAHRRFQLRSENQAESNAREVADEIRSIVARHRPRVVILAGEQRARTAIAENLENVQTEVEHVEAGGRGAGASEEALWEEVRQVLARHEAADQQELTGRLEERHGQGSGAALGLDEVIDALVQHRVDTLVVDLQKVRDMTVDPSRFPGIPLPEQATTRKELPADQVLVAAAAATDANIAVLPAEQTKGGGIAALLRWDT